MSWSYATLLALLTVFFALSCECDPGVRFFTKKIVLLVGSLKRVFMKQADASNFFRRRSRRGVKSQDELDAEQRQILAADERKREFHEEKRNEFESYAEEEHDEQDERSRESTEQWREFHYDGMHPAYEYNRHST
uniref:Unique cartilage matrix-associated protein n=1 Tax=Oreochromis niloticus TaxID=8128 RepID=I3JPM7_ORENI